MIAENALVVLFVVLLAITGFAYVLTEYDLVHPFSIVASVMSISAFLAMISADRWNLYMGVNAALLVITSVLVFGIACIVTDAYTKNNYYKSLGSRLCVERYHIPVRCFIAMCLIMAVFSYLQFQETYAASLQFGNKQGYVGMIKTVRYAIERGAFRFSRWRTYENIIIETFVCCGIFTTFSCLLGNKVRSAIPEIGKTFLLLLCYVPSLILSTGRESLLRIFVFSLVTGAILFQKRKAFSIQAEKVLFRYMVLGGAIFFLLFLGLGFFTGKVSLSGRGPLTILAHYVGLSMPAFSYFIENHVFLETPYIGGTSLINIYGNLTKLGMELPSPPVFLEFVQFDGINTNVYTMMRRYIADYGIIGMHLVLVIMGIFYSAFYNFVRFRSRSFWILIFYGTILMPLFFSMNDGRFLEYTVSTATFYEIISIYITCKLCIYKR